MQNPFHQIPRPKPKGGNGFDTDAKIYEVDIMFYTPQPDDHYFNHMVAAVSGPFSHVEIGFPTYTRNQQQQNAGAPHLPSTGSAA
eukprot:378939-Rhodomonas_salina.1